MPNVARPIALLAAWGVTAWAAGADAPTPKEVAAARATLRQLVHPAPMQRQEAEHIAQLVEQLGADRWRVREDATQDLIRIGPKARDLVETALDNPDLEARTRARDVLQRYRADEENTGGVLSAAADVLAAADEKWLVEALIALLAHKDVELRYAAEYSLRRVTGGRRFGYSAYASAEAREAAAERWRRWWDESRGQFRFPSGAEGPGAGGVLVANAAAREVQWVGLDGRVRWTKRFMTHAQPFIAQPLANGNTFIVLRMQGLGTEPQTLLAEYGRRGSVLRLKGIVHDACRLPNGNTLVPRVGGSGVIEIDAAGKRIVWQFDCGAAPRSLQRLDNGNTLLSVYPPGRVLEVNRAGHVVWEQTGLMPQEAVKLDSGNVLVVEQSRRIVEIDRKHDVVWTWSAGAGQPISARRLRDGRTVIYDRTQGLIVVDKSGRTVKTLSTAHPEGGEQIHLLPADYQPPQSKEKDN